MSVRACKWAYDLFEAARLPPAERLVLLALCWEHTDSEGCRPSQARIADLTGYPERRVRTLLSDLETRGLITRKRGWFQGKKPCTQYTLFGKLKAGVTGERGPVSNRSNTAGYSNRRTGADYRGYIYIPSEGAENVVHLHAEDRKTSGGKS